jgi:hypothetical protein
MLRRMISKVLSQVPAQRAVALGVVLVAPGAWLAHVALDPPAAPAGATTPVAGQRIVEVAASAPAVAAVAAEAAGNPLLTPEAMLVPSALLRAALTADEKRAMAAELDRLQTRHASELVSVISSASQEPSPIPPSFLLSIAFAETRGKVLAVSPAGAAGLAQATPAAYLLEGFDGPLYITNQYLIGTRAFIMKKPLGDAVGIAERVIEGEVSHAEALELLARAKELRRVGIDELEALEPRAPEVFMQRVEAADEYNVKTLDQLERLLEARASKARLESFRDRRAQGVPHAAAGAAGQLEALRRVARGRARPHPRPPLRRQAGEVMLERPYEAGEVLGERLDARFSPTRMAEFLAVHAQTKRQQAMALGVPEEELEAWTAALYNGGLVNVTRMRAGLMGSIRETENYMQKVPEMRARLDGTTSLAAP